MKKVLIFILKVTLILNFIFALVYSFAIHFPVFDHSPDPHAREKMAIRKINSFKHAVEKFKDICGSYPSSDYGLLALFDKPLGLECLSYPQKGFLVSRDLLIDPWGRDMYYKYNQEADLFLIMSAGKDRVYFTEDDISNRAVQRTGKAREGSGADEQSKDKWTIAFGSTRKATFIEKVSSSIYNFFRFLNYFLAIPMLVAFITSIYLFPYLFSFRGSPKVRVVHRRLLIVNVFIFSASLFFLSTLIRL